MPQIEPMQADEQWFFRWAGVWLLIAAALVWLFGPADFLVLAVATSIVWVGLLWLVARIQERRHPPPPTFAELILRGERERR